MIPHWKPVWVEVPITVTLDAYDANDVVGGTLSCSASNIAGGGYIHAVRLVDDATQAEPYLLYVYDANPSTIADAAEFVPTEADWLKTIGCIPITAADYDTYGTEADAAFVKGKDRKTGEYVIFGNLQNGILYFRLVANGSTPDYADANDLTMHVCFMLA